MSRQVVRIGLVLIMLAVAAGSGYHLFITEQQIDAARAAEREFTALAWTVTVSLSDLRAAQQAYVAAGQDSGYWVEKVSASLDDVTSGLETLRRLSTTTGAVAALKEAGSTMGRLQRVDKLARDHTLSSQVLMASDLIFTDSLELARLAASSLEVARVSEQDLHDQLRHQRRNSQMRTIGTTMATGALVALLLLPIGRVTPTVAASTGVDGHTDVAAVKVLLPPGEGIESDSPQIPERVLDSGLSGESSAVAATPDLPLEEKSDTSSPAVSPDLQRAAELCTDLARLTSTADLPRVLERAADVLHASKLIIWVCDDSGKSLRPAIAHGYPAETLSRLGSVACDADNAAAAAYRTEALQVVPGRGASPGALVAPLLSPSRCIGVMSAELQRGWVTSEVVQATASILAAQLATVVTTAPPTQAEQAQAGH